MQYLINLDKELFKLINGQWTNSFFDWIMPWLRNSTVWMPLYFFILLFVLINYKKEGVWIVAFAIITVTLTDGISSKLIKPYFNRLRPCNDVDMATMVRFLLNSRPANGSFTSSHAANHFGIAMFLYTVLQKKLGKWMGLFFVWAFFICYAQVYVGVHYPLDILGGTALGCMLGYGTALVFNRFEGEKLNALP
jgi:membrane-associated phospholipid phosphatase